MLDVIITLGTIGAFAFVIYRKNHKKKTESVGVQTSEPIVSPLNADITAPLFSGNSVLITYPHGAQVQVLAFNFREFQNMEHLANTIDVKLNHLLLEFTNENCVPMFQYLVVGTTLVVVCVYTL